MSTDDRGSIDAQWRGQVRLPIAVAPTSGTAINTLRDPLLPLACWRLDDVRFAFDSSLVQPTAKPDFAKLAALWIRTGMPPASVFGHADPVGDDGYNKVLSGRRALAIYGILVRNVALWEQLYSVPHGGDDWRSHGVPTMLAALGQTSVSEFQTQEGLVVDGSAGPATRAVLFERYMDAVCTDASGGPFRLATTDFLGRGADPDHKGDVQGCSEFNPLRVLSADEEQAFAHNPDKTERNEANLPNRRVLVLLFPPGSRIDPGRWPCPRAREGDDGCRAQFWPDGELRRTPGATRREYATAKNTFACRFYDAMVRRSPCELVRTTLRLRLHGPDRTAQAGVRYRLELGPHEAREGTSDPDGRLLEADVFAPSRVNLSWGDAQDVAWLGRWPFSRRIYLDFDQGDDDQRMRKRLHNIGYAAQPDPTAALTLFQREHGLPETGQYDPPTQAALIAAHDAELTGGAP
jgi:Putative peptidoglycan binding domain